MKNPEENARFDGRAKTCLNHDSWDYRITMMKKEKNQDNPLIM